MYKIYTKPNCNFCVRAKSLLDSANIPYAELVIGVDITREEVLNKFPTARSVPIILEGTSYIGGYTELVEHLNPTSQLLTEYRIRSPLLWIEKNTLRN